MSRTAADGYTRLGEIPRTARDKIARFIRVAYPNMRRWTLQEFLECLAAACPEESEPMSPKRARDVWEAMRPDCEAGEGA